MFRTDLIILKKMSIRQNRMLFHAFSREYGKIHLFYKPRKSIGEIDVGTVINAFINR